MILAFQLAFSIYVAFVIFHALLANVFSFTRLLAPAAMLWIIGTSLGVALFWNKASICVLWATVAFSFSFFSFHCLVLVASRNSVTLRMMDEIGLAGRLQFSEMAEKFTDTESLQARLAAMERSGFFLRESGELRLSPKGILLGRLALFLRRLFSIESAG